jgi:hypothetical protein
MLTIYTTETNSLFLASTQLKLPARSILHLHGCIYAPRLESQSLMGQQLQAVIIKLCCILVALNENIKIKMYEAVYKA